MSKNNINVVIREHFAKQIEENIRTLLPIRRAAIALKMAVSIREDKLIIINKTYTVNNISELPQSLKPEMISVREEKDHVVFLQSLSHI